MRRPVMTERRCSCRGSLSFVLWLLMLLNPARTARSFGIANPSIVGRCVGRTLSSSAPWLAGTRDGLPISRCLLSFGRYIPRRCLYSSRILLHETNSFLSDPRTEDDFDDGISLLTEEPLEDDQGDSEKEGIIDLPRGIPEDFYVISQYETPGEGFDLSKSELIDTNEIERLGISARNVTLPVALMLLDPDEYPTLSRTRKACRKGTILVHRGPLGVDENTGEQFFDPLKCIRGRVGDRVFPGDVVAKQVRMGDGKYSCLSHKDPPFELPVVYEDDHFAIVNKPAGVVVYSHKGGGHGRNTVRSALPFALTAPRAGTYSVMRRPMAVHRLDKPTSGLLIIGKTKPAMVNLSLQFVARKVKKTYVAIINGIPSEPVETSMDAETAFQMGIDVDPKSDPNKWQLIDFSLDDQEAITVWRPLRYVSSLKAKDGILTQVELKPKTGRYHQLRRHMAWVRECPLVGDKEYDGGKDAMTLRGRGLFLCSNRVVLEHPFFNTEQGRSEWEALSDQQKFASGNLYLSEDGVVMVKASIDLPNKFHSFLAKEEERAQKLA